MFTAQIEYFYDLMFLIIFLICGHTSLAGIVESSIMDSEPVMVPLPVPTASSMRFQFEMANLDFYAAGTSVVGPKTRNMELDSSLFPTARNMKVAVSTLRHCFYFVIRRL